MNEKNLHPTESKDPDDQASSNEAFVDEVDSDASLLGEYIELYNRVTVWRGEAELVQSFDKPPEVVAQVLGEYQKRRAALDEFITNHPDAARRFNFVPPVDEDVHA